MPIGTKTLAGFAGLLLATTALAQDPSVPQRGQDSDPKLPPPSEQVPEKVRPEADGSGGATLSEKLEKSDGVLRPPGGVDPEIRTIPPSNDGSSMPVIKPPGEAK